jgi:hypothetical protein
MYDQTVSDILSKCSDRLLPLSQPLDCYQSSATELKKYSPEDLFPNARNSEVAYSALLLLLGCWDASHDLTNDDESPEGCYLHAIIHRIEPNPANSAYWWRQLGHHPLFTRVHAAARTILEQTPVRGWQLKPAWDPYLFNEWCEQARHAPGSEREQAALAIQRGEWDALFAWCAASPGMDMQ